MLTTIEPENVGPNTANAPSSTALSASALERQRLGDARVGLGVVERWLELLAEDAAGGVDLLDREVDAVLEVGARGGTRPRQLLDHGDLDLRVSRRGGQ
jgi:hypothetical protein